MIKWIELGFFMKPTITPALFGKGMVTCTTVAILTLTGCQSVGGLGNDSLAYQDSQLLDPLQLPEGQASQDFVPLYPTVDLGESPIKMSNDSNKKYQLPAPNRVISQ